MMQKNEKKKIAIDARMYTKTMVGIARYVQQLILSLSDLTDEVEWYYIVNTDDLEKFLLGRNVANCNFIVAKAKPLSLFEHIEMPYLLYKYKINLFHATSYITPIWVSCSYIYSILDTHHLIFPKESPKAALLYWKVIVFNAAKKANRIITISNNSKSDIQRYVNKDKPIDVIYLGFEPAKVINDFNIVMARYKILKPGYFLFVGNHHHHKNWERVLVAHNEYMKFSEAPRMLVVNLNREKCHRINPTVVDACKNVVFAGYFDDKDLPVIYKNAFCLVFPSLYEGFGLPILEAISQDVPVITSNISCLPEIAGDAAILVDPYNINSIKEALVSIEKNPELIEQIVSNGKKRIEQFSWEKCAKETLQTYKKVLKF